MVIALWRIMKTQEATAAALRQIVHTVSQLGLPA